MGRELQKKKNRSSISKVRMKPKSKRVNPLGNAIVAANWNSTQTLTQNYRRLGLTSRLNTQTGGSEVAASATHTSSKLAIAGVGSKPKILAPMEARVERDPETGKIVRVIHMGPLNEKKENPLNDPLVSDDEDEEMDETTGGRDARVGDQEVDAGIVRELEIQASMVAEKRPRKQSQREREWVSRLVEKYGSEDFERMARDRKLNPMQQTAADIGRRVGRWREGGAVL